MHGPSDVPDGAPSPDNPSPAFLDAFRRRAGAAGVLRFDAFVDLALFDPVLGYYRRRGPRVGTGPGTDFQTATVSSPLFGPLVAAACAALLGPEAASHTLVEIGAEPGGGLFPGPVEAFPRRATLRLGDPLVLGGPCAVVSNELFDAQPFRRRVRRGGAWREEGVALAGDGPGLRTVEMDGGAPPTGLPGALPDEAPEGYRIDAPVAAATLAGTLAVQPWSGLFVAFDYGRRWETLARGMPAGTASAFFRHTQSSDLLARPGLQDLTCHVCWDWIADALRAAGCPDPVVESQESFLARHAGQAIARALAAETSRVGPVRMSLLNLLHPANLGGKFQVIWAKKP